MFLSHSLTELVLWDPTSTQYSLICQIFTNIKYYVKHLRKRSEQNGMVPDLMDPTHNLWREDVNKNLCLKIFLVDKYICETMDSTNFFTIGCFRV